MEGPSGPEGDADMVEAKMTCSTETKINTTKRTIIIDPALVLFNIFQLSQYTVGAQYIYLVIGEKYNLTAALTTSMETNNTQLDGEALCGMAISSNNTAYILQQKVQAEAAIFKLYMALISEIPGCLLLPFFGSLMDMVGRRPMLILPLAGVLVRPMLYILHQLLPLPFGVLLLGGLTDVLFGGHNTFNSAAFAFFTDTVAPSRLGYRLALVDVIQSLSLAAMEVVMGFMIQATGFLWPFVLIIAGHLVNLLYVGFFVPESRAPSKTAWKSVSISKYITRSLKVFPKKRPNNGRTLLLVFFLSFSLTQFGIMGRNGIDSLYKLNSPFCWEASLIGIFNGVQSIVICFTQIVITVAFLKRLGGTVVICISLVSYIASFIMLGAAITSWMIFLSIVVGAASGILSPLMTAKMSNFVTFEEKGALFAMSAVLNNLLRIGSYAVFKTTFGITMTRGIFKGTVFMMMAGFVSLGLIMFITLDRLEKKEKSQSSPDEVKEWDTNDD